MQDFLFDSRLELDRLPSGAVPAGTAVRFGIRADERLNLKSLYFVIKNDANGETTKTAMDPVWTENGWTRFETAVTTSETGLFWYWFSAEKVGGEAPVGKAGTHPVFMDGVASPWQLTVYSPDFSTPDWIKGGVFYHIFVDRFCKGGSRPLKSGAVFRDDWGGVPRYLPDDKGIIRNNDFFGGDLDGVIEKLPYLEELGVSCIYLSPVFEAASNHKYDTSNYMKIDPSFGDEEIFRKLCERAGELGIRVICDGVFNHTGDDSVYFDRYGTFGGNGAYNSKESPYYSWYSFSHWPDEYEAWWGIKTLPQVREDNPEYRKFIFGENGVLRHWMRCGASGWRLDVADELPDPFLNELRETVKSENHDALIIGEVWEDATTKIAYGHRRHYFEGAQLDSVMNYPFKNGIIDYLLSGNAQGLSNVVESICENYPKPSLDCLMNGLGTHDTPRILTVLGGDRYETREERASAALDAEARKSAVEKLKSAVVLQCSLPGVPCVYYGDEAGLEGYEDPFNRRCYPWDHEDAEILNWYKAVLTSRRKIPAFSGGEYKTLRAEGGLLVFQRKSENSRVITAVNMGAEDAAFELEPGAKLLVSSRVQIDENRLRLSPASCAIIELP